MIKIKKGLDLPIKGKPEQRIHEFKNTRTAALLGNDYQDLRPSMAVQENDIVKKGQLLFTDKNMPDVQYTSPVSGYIKAINRGERRALLSVVIQADGADEVTFNSFSEAELCTLSRERIIRQLLDSGLWTAIRSRPFSKVADPKTKPHSIFINVMDSNPLAPASDIILQGNERDFVNGVHLISRLTEGNLYLCKSPATVLPGLGIENLAIREFSGPHPAGNVGTHIHFLDPVCRGKSVWYIGLQDVIAVGLLFRSGRLFTERTVALAGPSVTKPRLIKCVSGAALDQLTAGELVQGEQRVISGSILSGHHALGETAFLGRYHQQISVIPENRKRELLGWLNPGLNRFSIKNVVLSRFLAGRLCDFTTTTNGEIRPILPSGNYERVMPLDIMPLFLIRSLAVQDIEEAENLGCLELDEEDLALCALVCPSKQDFGSMLRRTLDLIEAEG